MTKLIKITDVRKVYHGAISFEALKGVSLSINAGDYLAVMGHSGSGKSTLLHLVGGLDGPTSGGISIDGHHLDAMNETELARFRRTNVGFVFQFFNLISNLTCQANVELPALLTRKNRKSEVRKRATALLLQLGVAAQADKYPSELSGGQQQRVAIARALVNQPKLLLVDEPTGNLDSASSQVVLRILKECNSGGQTILMVTHDPRAAAEARHVLFLHDGCIVDSTPGGNIQEISRRLALLQ